MKYRITIGDQPFEVEKTGGKTLLNGTGHTPDLVRNGDHAFHLLIDNQGYSIEILQTDIANKRMTLLVNGQKTEVSLQDETDLLLAGMGMSASSNAQARELKAPMPGLVVDILVNPGQPFLKGEPLLILEAMKMENVLKAVSDGTIHSVEVAKGNAVEKNQLLMKFT